MSDERNAGRETSLFVARTPEQIEQENKTPAVNVAAFKPTSIKNRRADPAVSRVNAELAGYRSEMAEVPEAKSKREEPARATTAAGNQRLTAVSNEQRPRRFRTDRNFQVNIKATVEVRDRFNKLCDDRNWASGVTLEYLLDLHDRTQGKATNE